jgi:hypothetical protein
VVQKIYFRGCWLKRTTPENLFIRSVLLKMNRHWNPFKTFWNFPSYLKSWFPTIWYNFSMDRIVLFKCLIIVHGWPSNLWGVSYQSLYSQNVPFRHLISCLGLSSHQMGLDLYAHSVRWCGMLCMRSHEGLDVWRTALLDIKDQRGYVQDGLDT